MFHYPRLIKERGSLNRSESKKRGYALKTGGWIRILHTATTADLRIVWKRSLIITTHKSEQALISFSSVCNT